MYRIKAAYVGHVEDKAMLKNSIKVMMSNLDPHSAYLLGREYLSGPQEYTGGKLEELSNEKGGRSMWYHQSTTDTTGSEPVT